MRTEIRKYVILFKAAISLIFPPYEDDSHYDKVKKICNKEIKRHPEDIFANWFLAYAHVNQKNYNEAQTILETLVSSGVNNKAVICLLSRVYFNIKDFAKVIGILEKTHIKDGDSAKYYLGISLVELGRIKEGIDHLEKYRIHHSRDYNVLWKLGYEYFRIKEYEKALNCYIEARRLKPGVKLDEGIKLCYERLKEDKRLK